MYNCHHRLTWTHLPFGVFTDISQSCNLREVIILSKFEERRKAGQFPNSLLVSGFCTLYCSVFFKNKMNVRNITFPKLSSDTHTHSLDTHCVFFTVETQIIIDPPLLPAIISGYHAPWYTKGALDLATHSECLCRCFGPTCL